MHPPHSARLASIAALTMACAVPAPVVLAPWSPPLDGFVRSDRARLRDETGRVLVFRGANARVQGVFDVALDPVRCPPPSDVLEEIPAFGEPEAVRMRRLGFNVLRLPIHWSAIEPTEGAYDDAYLDRVAAIVDLARAHDLCVVIDLHQDAWGKDVGEDGAPLWATLPAPAMPLCGPLGDTLASRRTAALPYFSTFFDDEDADPADVHLQAAYLAMASHVASRFASDEAVLGYDLFNEPLTNDGQIGRFHVRLAEALRAVDTRHPLLFEPSALRNLTDIGPRPTAMFPDALGVYAVHLYTLSFSDPRHELDTITRARLEPNVTRAVGEAALFGAPMFAGEWGIRPDSPGSATYVRIMYDLFDDHAASSTVWLWQEGSQGGWGFYDRDAASGAWTERPLVFAAHARVYAEAIAGEPSAIHYDPDTHVFELRFDGRSDRAPHVVHVPEEPYFPASLHVLCDGMPVEPAAPRDAATGRIEVLCAGPGAHTLRIEP